MALLLVRAVLLVQAGPVCVPTQSLRLQVLGRVLGTGRLTREITVPVRPILFLGRLGLALLVEVAVSLVRPLLGQLLAAVVAAMVLRVRVAGGITVRGSCDAAAVWDPHIRFLSIRKSLESPR